MPGLTLSVSFWIQSIKNSNTYGYLKVYIVYMMDVNQYSKVFGLIFFFDHLHHDNVSCCFFPLFCKVTKKFCQHETNVSHDQVLSCRFSPFYQYFCKLRMFCCRLQIKKLSLSGRFFISLIQSRRRTAPSILSCGIQHIIWFFIRKSTLCFKLLPDIG